MKKIFFSMLAIALLSTTGFAAGGKTDAKKHKANTAKTCPTNCPQMKDCQKGTICPQKPGCTCH